MSDTIYRQGDGEFTLLRKILTRLNEISGGGDGPELGADNIWTGTNTWGNVGRFNAGLGVNGLPSQSAMDTTALMYLTRTSAPGPGVRLGGHFTYQAAFPNTVVAAAMLFDVVNTGSASGGGGHLLGVVGRAQDTSSGALPIYGVEGKVIVRGTNDNNAAIWGIADYDGATHAGRKRTVISGFCEIFNGDISTPVNEGETCVFEGLNGVGGDPTQRFLIKGAELQKIRTGGSTYVQLEHNGTDASLSVNAGAIRLYAPGNFVVLQDAVGFAPFVSGASLGINGFRWGANLTGANSTVLLTGSVTPTNNTELMFQLSSDSLLTFKVRGSDGVVRSGSLALA